jgi:hypothetical protein
MNNLSKTIPFIERKIIELLLDTLFENGAKKIEVFDSEETSCEPTSDRKQIEEAIGITDETTLFICGESGLRESFVWLVHGNGEDLITDCSANEWMDGVMAVIEEEVY